MKIISKLFLAEKTILTLDGDILSMNPSKVIVYGKEYEFTVAFRPYSTMLKMVLIQKMSQHSAPFLLVLGHYTGLYILNSI